MKWPRTAKPKLEKLDMSQFTPLPASGYLVGGAVRDALLNRPAHDFDWLVPDTETSARGAEDELEGIAFPLDKTRGYWRVVSEGPEGSPVVRDYIPLRGSLEDNLRQRDYTVNALAADLTGELHDPCGGLEDLKRRALRMVSAENLEADPLRPLRGARLSVQLEFHLEPATQNGICALAERQQRGEVPLPALERAGEELQRLIAAPKAAYGMRQLADLGLMELYLPELMLTKGLQQGGFHHLDVFEHSLEALNQLLQRFPEASPALRWATLLHDIGKPETKQWDTSGRYYHFYGHDKLGAGMAKTMLRRLRLPSETVEHASHLIHYHMLPLPKNGKEARRFVHRRRELLPDLLKLMIADREAARGPLSSEAGRQRYRIALSRVLEILAEPPPPKPLLDGREIMALLGLEPGPKVGEAVRLVREAEAVGDVRTKMEAEVALRRYASEQGWLE